MQRVFTPRVGANLTVIGTLVEGLHNSRYETRPMERTLEVAFSENHLLFGGLQEERLHFGARSQTLRVTVVAASVPSNKAFILSNYNRPVDTNIPSTQCWASEATPSPCFKNKANCSARQLGLVITFNALRKRPKNSKSGKRTSTSNFTHLTGVIVPTDCYAFIPVHELPVQLPSTSNSFITTHPRGRTLMAQSFITIQSV